MTVPFKTLQALINLGYAIGDRPIPNGSATDEEMARELHMIANEIRESAAKFKAQQEWLDEIRGQALDSTGDI